MVTQGVIQRGAQVRVVRDGTIVYDGRIDSLKRFQDDAREVAQGFECGLTLENYNDLKEGDVLEVYAVQGSRPHVVSGASGVPTLTLVGGPTALITYGGLRILTDPTFDPPGRYESSGSPVILTKLDGPAVQRSRHRADRRRPPVARPPRRQPRRGRTRRSGPRGSSAHDRRRGRAAGIGAAGLEPGDALDLDLPGGGALNVTAVAADHGPPEVAAVNGPVIGFVLRAEGLPAVYVSGDNASVDVVRDVRREHGPFDVAVLFAGAGPGARALGRRRPADVDPGGRRRGRSWSSRRRRSSRSTRTAWAHFTADGGDLEAAFSDAGLGGRLRRVLPGETIDLS